MSLLGGAALAMWWDMAPDMRAEFEDWHSHEHFPERLGIPGFNRASRWSSAFGGDGFFVLYELQAHETLSSSPYLARLNAPTAWSTKLMPHHRHMVRSQCTVADSRGAVLARHALTLRLSPSPGRDAELRQGLSGLIAQIATRPGLSGGHLLQTRTPALSTTAEQQLRGGGDSAADWIFIACGYSLPALEFLQARELDPQALSQMGAAPGQIGALHTLSHSLSAGELNNAA